MERIDENTALLSSSSSRGLGSFRGTPTLNTGVSPIISETDDTITVRRPLTYHSIRDGPEQQAHGERTRAMMQRYKYYSKLSSHGDISLMMPNHIVPSEYFLVIPINVAEGTQSSIVTIFSIWNTMMGTSILSMPWALQKAGFAWGISLMIVLAGITLYTAYRIMTSPATTGARPGTMEFTDVCGYYLGRWGTYTSTFFSLAALTGAAIVYWVLMSNFLYNAVKFVYEKVHSDFPEPHPVLGINITDAICPHPTLIPFPAVHNNTDNSVLSAHTSAATQATFYKVWTQTESVPFFLLLIMAPLINIKSPTFFTKFNSLGTISVAYILSFVTYKASRWGFNVNFSDPSDYSYISQFEWTFPALSGILALAYFIHNCVLSIVRNQKHPENNGRDLSIAFALVAFTYIFIGALFYLSFPLPKSCIEDNLLNNFATDDVMAFVARVFLFFQMITVFPLLCYIFRIQVLNTLTGTDYPGLFHVLGVNAVLVSACLLFAIFLPRIGTIIRFSGALCGFAYIFTLPCIVYVYSLRFTYRRIRWYVYVIHALIIAVGFGNFVAQFVIIGHT